MKLDDGRVFSDFVANILNSEDISLKSDGAHRRPFCYISDAIDGCFRILLTGEPGTPYNVGNPQQFVSILECAQILQEAFSERRIKVRINTAAQPQHYARSPIISNCPDVERLVELGWAPQVTITEGFTRTVSSFEEHLRSPVA